MVVHAVALRIVAVASAAADAAASVIIVATVAAMAAATARLIAADAAVVSTVIVVAAAILAVAKLPLRRAVVVAVVLLPKPLPRPRRLLRRPRLRRTNPPNQTRPGHDSPGLVLGETSTLERGESRPVRDSTPNSLRLSKPDLELEARLFLLHRDGPHTRDRPMAYD